MTSPFFTPFRERSVEIGERVEVYRNLHLDDGYSIRSAKSKLVLAHCKSVMLTNCEFVVSQGGRNRTIKRQQKEIHAFVRGTLSAVNESVTSNDIIRYNPYLFEDFVDVHGSPAIFAQKVNCIGKHVCRLA